MKFIENLPLSQIRKQVLHEFREIFPIEINENIQFLEFIMPVVQEILEL